MRAAVLLAVASCGRFGFARTATDDATSSPDAIPVIDTRTIASFAFVQAAANKGDGTTRADTAFAQAVTAGDLLVIETDYNATTLPTVTDDRGSTWHQLAPFDGNGAFNRNVVSWAIAPSTGDDTVHATIPSSTLFFELRVHEYAGAGTFDTQVGATGDAAGPAHVVITTTVANELVYLVTIFNNDTTPSAGPSFTQRTAYAEDYTGDAIFAVPGTYNADTEFTGTPINWTSTAVSFIPM